ncbi:hypothetical protein J11TS1_09800 [Oceanobacillus sp. J11TS1]|nr:hypothetical protein J11TS1_09800 [Oceanobacillus sp. J11TS1]
MGAGRNQSQWGNDFSALFSYRDSAKYSDYIEDINFKYVVTLHRVTICYNKGDLGSLPIFVSGLIVHINVFKGAGFRW